MTLENDSPRRADRFPSTQWSVVVAAGREASSDARLALAGLCEVYWYPLYGYLRGRGTTHEDAQDQVQGFFARFLKDNYFRALSPERGKFRSYLLKAMKHYLANEYDRARAKKRGGGQSPLPLELPFSDGERKFQSEPVTTVTAETLYQRRWALALLDRALSRLEGRYRSAGKSRLFATLKAFLPGGGSVSLSQKQAAEALQLSPGAVKVAIHRLRTRYRDALRWEVAQTVADQDDVETEIRYLMDMLSA